MTVFTIKARLKDDFGRKTTKSWETEDISGADLGAEFLAADGVAQALMTDLANISGANILYYTISYEFTYTDVATADANLDEGLTLVVLKEDNKEAVLKVPAPELGIFNPDGTVDLAHAAVTAYFANFTVGGGITLSDGESAVSTVRGRLDR